MRKALDTFQENHNYLKYIFIQIMPAGGICMLKTVTKRRLVLFLIGMLQSKLRAYKVCVPSY